MYGKQPFGMGKSLFREPSWSSCSSVAVQDLVNMRAGWKRVKGPSSGMCMGTLSRSKMGDIPWME